MKKKRITAFVMASGLMLVAGGSFLCKKAIGAYEVAFGETLMIEGGTESVDVSRSLCEPSMPEVLYQKNEDMSSPVVNVYTYYETYNCFVAYPIQNTDYHAKRLCFGKNNGAFNEYYFEEVGRNEIFRFIAIPSSASIPELCQPSLYLVSAYCTDCGSKSIANAVIFNNLQYAYNGYCNYGCQISKTDGIIQSSYQADSTWEHFGGTGDKIYFSIAYNGQVAEESEDLFLTIPWIGYQSVSVVVNGVTFSVRTGPDKISVKASTSVECNLYDTVFAFKVVEDN